MRLTTLRIGEILDVDGVRIRPVKTHAGAIRLAIDAPPGVTILRGELVGKPARRTQEGQAGRTPADDGRGRTP